MIVAIAAPIIPYFAINKKFKMIFMPAAIEIATESK